MSKSIVIFLGLSVLLFTELPALAQSGWEIQSPVPLQGFLQKGTRQNLYKVSFRSSSGIAVGDSGTILRTTNDGRDWAATKYDSTTNLFGVVLCTDSIAFAVGDAGTVLRSLNGGINWARLSSRTEVRLLSVAFSDGRNGIVAGDPDSTKEAVILRTTDQGETWRRQLSGTPYTVFSLNMVDSTIIYGVSGASFTCDNGCLQSNILHSNDGGQSWNLHYVGGYIITGISAIDAMNVTVVGSSFSVCGIFRTTDGGNNWLSQTRNVVGHTSNLEFSDVSYYDSLNGIIVGLSDLPAGSCIFRTTNGGVSWLGQVVGGLGTISYGVSFYGALQATVVGTEGIIMHTETGGMLGVAANGKSDARGVYRLQQNYPNPFNPSTMISYQIPKAGFVSLKIYNLLGQEVAKLVDGVEEAGYKSVSFNATSFPSGVYFYRLQAGMYSGVKKMLLMK